MKLILFGALCLALLEAPGLAAQGRGQASTPPAAPSAQLNPLPQSLPRIQLSVQPADGREDYALPIQLILLLTVLTLAPSIIIMMTSFTRLVVVFHFLRMALGTQQSPPNQVLIGLALFLSFFVMYPALSEINTQALQPYLNRQITQAEALERAAVPLKEFMLRQTRAKDLLLFMDLARLGPVQDPKQVPLYVLVPAFLISELRIAFQIGFLLYLPFLVIDLVVSSVLLSMGMMFLPPVMVSLPFKLLIFVLTDGWYLIVESMLRGFAR